MTPSELQFNPATNKSEYIFDLYTWFPYESGQCGTLNDIVLLERCALGKDRNTSLYPSKIPENMHGCPIRVLTFASKPNVILTVKHDKEDNSSIYEYSGVEIEYLKLLAEAINMTVKYLPPLDDKFHLSDFFFHGLISVVNDEADVTLGDFPLHHRATAYCEPTTPYIYASFRWYVPCAKPIRRIDNIINVFTVPVWSTLVLTLVLSSLLFWGMSSGPSRSVTKESTTYKAVSQCFSNAWAVLMGVSVAKMPRTFRLRAFFFTFVCYCFAMNTVFQVYFTSFLIEPVYEKQVETFDELQQSEVIYLAHPSLDEIGVLINYDEHKLLPRRENCEPYEKCMLRVLQGQDVTTMVMDFYAEYFASTAGQRKIGKKPLCSTDKAVFTMGLTMYMSKGNILLQRFNVLIQRCLEAGLGDKYWSELKWNATIRKSDERIDDDDVSSGNLMYFVFTVFHLRVAFCLLAFGNTLSFIVFLAELLSKLFFPRVGFCKA